MNQSPAVSTAVEGNEYVGVLLKEIDDFIEKSSNITGVPMINQTSFKEMFALSVDMFSSRHFPLQAILCVLSEENEDNWEAMFHIQDEPAGSLYHMIARGLIDFWKKHVDNMQRSIDLPSVLNFAYGTENCVNIRRELVTLRDKMLEFYEPLPLNPRWLSSGSLSEGLAYPKSDDDVMLFDNEYLIFDSDSNVTNDSNSLMIVYSQYFHGYCSIFDKNGSIPDELITIINGLIETDIVICYECPFWPKVAREWISRDRSHGWPTREQIKIIGESGCHVVPIGDPRSQHCAHEWRISFSLAERILVHSFNHPQFLTYSVLRNALKKIIDKRFPNVLCSYFIKTVMFHTIERTHRTMWRMDNLEICYIVCLSVLYLFIDYKNCPNYFIPRNNMMSRKINQTNRQPLLNLIRRLIRIRILGFDFKRYADWSHFQHIEFIHDQEFFTSYLLFEFSFSLRQYIWDFFDSKSCMPQTSKLILSFRELNSKNEFIQRILNNARNYLSQTLMSVLWRKQNRNKLKYNNLRCFARYTQNLPKGDLTTNTLMKATYLYLVCKTETCISIIKKFKASFPPHAIVKTSTVSGSRAYMNHICSREYTLDEKAGLAWYPHFILYSKDIYAFPSHLSIWFETLDTLDIHPLTYAYLLESLCFIQLKNIKSLIKSTDDMMKHLTNLTNNYDILYTQMCMAIIRFAHGDNNTSYEWFKLVYKMLEKLSKRFEDGDGVSHGTSLKMPRQQMQKAICDNTRETQAHDRAQFERKNEVMQHDWNHLIKGFRRAVLFYVACLISREISYNSNVKDNFALPFALSLD